MNPYKRPRLSSGPIATSASHDASSPRSSPNLSDAESQHLISKKARLSTPVGISKVAGMEEDEDDLVVDEGLELARKEAIYRQMLMYKRLHSQATTKYHKLEKEKDVLDGQVRSVEVCWTQLVNVVQGAAGVAEQKPAVDVLTPEIHELVQSQTPDLSTALQSRLSATQHLIHRIIELATPSSSQSLQSQFVRSESDRSALQATVAILKSGKRKFEEELEDAREQLIASQKRSDRLRMEFEKYKRDRGGSVTKSEERQGNGVVPASTTNKDVKADSDIKMEVDSRPSTPNGHVKEGTPAASAAGATVRAFNAGADENERDVAWLKECLDVKQKEIETMRARMLEAEQESDFHRSLVYYPQDEVILASTVVKTLQEQLTEAMTNLGKANTRWEELNNEVDGMRDDQEGFRESVLHEARTEIDNLRNQMRTKEADVLRLRQQRDVLQNDVDAKRIQIAQRHDHAQAMQALAEKREERLQLLGSEIRRIRSKMAASMGNEEMLDYLLEGAELGHVQSLEEKIKSATQREAALQAQVDAYSANTADVAACMATETKLRQELAELHQQIQHYQKIFSSEGDLGAQLEAKEKERKGLELKVKEGEAAQLALYGEVEGLTKAWEGLGQQLKSKVYDLKDLETKVVKAEVEKSKAFNKYYDVCREKEGLVMDKQASERTIKLQRTALEKCRDVENGLHAQLSESEKSLTNIKNNLIGHQAHMEHLVTQNVGLKAENEATTSRHNLAMATAKERLIEREEAKAAQARAEDEVRELRRKLKEAESKQSSGSSKSVANGKEYADLQKERDMLFGILRCSACSLRFKEKIISKCLHTFCKECIESRMESRSRKCPTCMVPISHSDIKPLF